MLKRLLGLCLMLFIALAPSLAQENGIPAADELLRQAQAYDKVSGKELAALCFYKAYLLAAPASESAKEAGARIQELDKKIEGNIRQLISSAQKIQENIPASLFLNIAEAQMNLGDTDSAFSTLDSCKQAMVIDGNENAGQEYVKICLLESRAKDFTRAARTAAEIPSDEKNQGYKITAYRNLVIKLLKEGDSAAAKRLVDGIREEEVKNRIQMYLDAGLSEPVQADNGRAQYLYGSELKNAELKYLVAFAQDASSLEEDALGADPQEEGQEDTIGAKISADCAARLSAQLSKIRNFETECMNLKES